MGKIMVNLQTIKDKQKKKMAWVREVHLLKLEEQGISLIEFMDAVFLEMFYINILKDGIKTKNEKIIKRSERVAKYQKEYYKKNREKIRAYYKENKRLQEITDSQNRKKGQK